VFSKNINMLRMKNILSGLALLLAFSFQLNAQSSKIFGEIYIPDNASISIFNKHTFHDISTLSTVVVGRMHLICSM